jgi:predicted ABC-type ATPase
MKPQLVMLAGPNGAGKSTYYDAFLADSDLPFLNADLVAASLQIDSFEAARVLDAHRDRMIANGLGFVTETVFSDPGGVKLRMLQDARDAGYEVIVIYIGIASARLSELRVEQRIARGGHDVPREKIASRYKRSLANLAAAIPIANVVHIYDNSSAHDLYRRIAQIEDGVLTFRAKGRLPTWCRGVISSLNPR